MKKTRMIGITFVWVYVIFTLIVLLYTWSCPSDVCKTLTLIPALPWALVKQNYVREHFYALVILIVFNASLLYAIGYYGSMLFSMIKKKD